MATSLETAMFRAALRLHLAKTTHSNRAKLPSI